MRCLLDSFFSNFRWYRALRGGRWERTAACCRLPICVWWKVDLFDMRPSAHPAIIAREDYRGLSAAERTDVSRCAVGTPLNHGS